MCVALRCCVASAEHNATIFPMPKREKPQCDREGCVNQVKVARNLYCSKACAGLVREAKKRGEGDVGALRSVAQRVKGVVAKESKPRPSVKARAVAASQDFTEEEAFGILAMAARGDDVNILQVRAAQAWLRER